MDTYFENCLFTSSTCTPSVWALSILGRFTEERKAVLEVIRNELRKRDYLPLLFDFEKPASRDLTETISTLAHMARLVMADITEAKSGVGALMPAPRRSLMRFLSRTARMPMMKIMARPRVPALFLL